MIELRQEGPVNDMTVHDVSLCAISKQYGLEDQVLGDRGTRLGA